MTHRERLVAALNHREPDRVPFDLGATIITSITKTAYVNFRNFLGLPEEDVKLFDHVQQLPFLDEKLLKIIGADVRMVQVPYVSSSDQRYSEEDRYLCFTDRWGAKLQMPKLGGHYFDWVDFPITEISLDALKHYRWPEPDSAETIRPLWDRARDLSEHSDLALAGTSIFGGGVFEQPERMMGMERFLLSLALDERFADYLMERITDIYIENIRRYLEKVGPYLQVFVYWNDFTGQEGPLIAPEVYRRLVKPKDRRIIEEVKKRTDAKIFYHSCGAIRDFIPDLIEIGVDILNPVQTTAKGMNAARLKRDFGNDITFWGGGCDTQKILPRGTPAQVREEVNRRIHDLAPGGGFVFSTIHNIQGDVPPENIMALIEAVRDYGAY